MTVILLTLVAHFSPVRGSREAGSGHVDLIGLEGMEDGLIEAEDGLVGTNGIADESVVVGGELDGSVMVGGELDGSVVVGGESVGNEFVSMEDNQDCLVEDVIDRLASVASLLNVPHDTEELFSLVSPGTITLEHSAGLKIHGTHCRWSHYYPVLSFLMNGHLFANYSRLSGMLGLPPCSSKQWHRIMVRLEKYVTDLAEWSCAQVREEIIRRGDGEKWVASFDGFYQTRGHYSNNSSSSVHDYASGKIAYFSHRTKRGKGHNWEGTSAGAETDMLDETLARIQQDGLVLQEVIADKDSSVNSTFCRHFPEGTVTYCSNHCAKALHKHLETIRKNRCMVSTAYNNCCLIIYNLHYSAKRPTSGVKECLIAC